MTNVELKKKWMIYRILDIIRRFDNMVVSIVTLGVPNVKTWIAYFLFKHDMQYFDFQQVHQGNKWSDGAGLKYRGPFWQPNVTEIRHWGIKQ